MATRFWFRVSELYMTPPFTLIGVLATSWTEATERLVKEPSVRELVLIPPAYYFLSCNVDQLQALECSDETPVLVRRPETKRPSVARAKRRRSAKRSAA